MSAKTQLANDEHAKLNHEMVATMRTPQGDFLECTNLDCDHKQFYKPEH